MRLRQDGQSYFNFRSNVWMMPKAVHNWADSNSIMGDLNDPNYNEHGAIVIYPYVVNLNDKIDMIQYHNLCIEPRAINKDLGDDVCKRL